MHIRPKDCGGRGDGLFTNARTLKVRQCWISCFVFYCHLFNRFKRSKHGEKTCWCNPGWCCSYMVCIIHFTRHRDVWFLCVLFWFCFFYIRWLHPGPGVCVRLPCEHVCVEQCKHRGHRAALPQHTLSWASLASELEDINRNTHICLLNQFKRISLRTWKYAALREPIDMR